MPFKKGQPKKGGRKKGSKNKFTSLQDEFLKAFNDEDGIGGGEGIKTIIKGNDRRKMVFLQMVTKMLPSNVDVEHSGEVQHTVFMMPRPGKRTKKENAD